MLWSAYAYDIVERWPEACWDGWIAFVFWEAGLQALLETLDEGPIHEKREPTETEEVCQLSMQACPLQCVQIVLRSQRVGASRTCPW